MNPQADLKSTRFETKNTPAKEKFAEIALTAVLIT